MTDVPPVNPVTVPSPATVATVVLLLVHVPVPSVKDSVNPGHTAPVLPVIAAGGASTVTTCVAIQYPAEPLIKVIVDVPAFCPTRLLPTNFATDVSLLFQLRSGEASVSVVADPVHMMKVPVIGGGLE